MITIVVVLVLPVSLLIFFVQFLIRAIGSPAVSLGVPLAVPSVFVAVPVVIILAIRIVDANVFIVVVAIMIPILREGRDRASSAPASNSELVNRTGFFIIVSPRMNSAVEKSHC